MGKKLFLSLFLVLGILFTPFFADAHVKWFTELEPQKESIEQIINPQFLFVTLLSAIILAILPQVLPKLMSWGPFKKIDMKLESYRSYSTLILKYGTAAALVLQVLTGALFAPELSHYSTLLTILSWIAIACLLIPNPYATKIGALVLLTLFGVMIFDYGIFHMLDYAFYLAIIFVLLMTKTKYEKWSFPFLYLATGLSLCWVAVEKWVYPEMSVDIVSNHQVPTFFFSPETFVSLSAFIEFIVGYLLIVGILNRLLSFVLTGVFVMTTMLFGWVEVVGHFMIHIVLIIFIIEGISFYKPPIKIHKTIFDQMIFVFLNFIFVLATILLIYYRFA
ncbi:DoxX family membrane protein [Halalkalibacter alkalisediminis]|uniref:DoxX family membrane protein n=1 Tax=Halalkalibacter alkalisediminis TaxID=935616 RepID=A0ABV6NG38_9BACI|nr:DoxX family membrane protein [Halalkalibacter alkalisediminis]